MLHNLRPIISPLVILIAAPLLMSKGRLMQGPMVGSIESESVTIWARVAGPSVLNIRYSDQPSFFNAQLTSQIIATKENDYCVTAKIDGLRPNSFYYYQVLVDGEPVDYDGYPLLTAPSKEMRTKFSIGFGSGARSDKDGLQAIWLQVQNARPNAFFWLGGNEAFSELSPEFQAEEYRRQRSIPFLQPLLRSITQLSTWDAPATLPQDELADSLEIFQRYWPNPAFGTEEAPGSYFNYQYGGVDFIFLDTYSYRDEDDHSTILGEVQMKWLQQQLSQSEATFKVLLSGSSWSNLAAENHNTWTAYPEERKGLFSYIRENEIDGIVLLSGDDDEAEIKAIPMSREGGYDFYELVSSPLAQIPAPDYTEDNTAVIAIEEPYADSMNFGTLTFDMAEDDPVVSLKVINVFGENVFPEFELRASELTNGQTSWKSKVPAEAVAHIEARTGSAL